MGRVPELDIPCRINPPPEQGALQYNMTRLAMTLNTAEPELLRQLPPTDSRFRPDQRALEVGRTQVLASASKLASRLHVASMVLAWWS